MRKAWLTTIAASAVAMAGTSVQGSPADMAASGHRSAKSTPASKIASDTPPAMSDLPSAQISPVRNPLKYFGAAISELPIASKASRGPATNPVMPPARHYNNALSLGAPHGPQSPELCITAAQACERQGDMAGARRHYQQALSIWPGHVEVLRAAARMEDRLGELPLAESLYQQAVAANPQHAGALNDLGLCLARQGKLEASVQVIEQAIQLQPDKPLYRNNAATVLVEMRQDQRALGHLAHVHGSADANYNFGQLLVQRGRAADATPYFQAAVDQNPQMQPAHVALAKLQPVAATNSTTWSSTSASTAAPQQTVPEAASAIAPQHAPQASPQITHPTPARGPAFGASSNGPPAYYAPSSPYPPATNPIPGAAQPRYLPPVATRPGSMQR